MGVGVSYERGTPVVHVNLVLKHVNLVLGRCVPVPTTIREKKKSRIVNVNLVLSVST